MDIYDGATRSATMRAVRSSDTGAEMTVRRMLHGAGYRYRLHVKTLPGKPDITFPSRRKVIFVHGCFWHQHTGCKNADRPASNCEYWNSKLDRNVLRDAENITALKSMGWDVHIVWECQIRDADSLMQELRQYLDA